MMEIPTYKNALERHETPLDVFISRWEPIKPQHETDSFRDDLAALIEYVEELEKGQHESN